MTEIMLKRWKLNNLTEQTQNFSFLFQEEKCEHTTSFLECLFLTFFPNLQFMFHMVKCVQIEFVQICWVLKMNDYFKRCYTVIYFLFKDWSTLFLFTLGNERTLVTCKSCEERSYSQKIYTRPMSFHFPMQTKKVYFNLYIYSKVTNNP